MENPEQKDPAKLLFVSIMMGIISVVFFGFVVHFWGILGKYDSGATRWLIISTILWTSFFDPAIDNFKAYRAAKKNKKS
jgi:hypothetical protein